MQSRSFSWFWKSFLALMLTAMAFNGAQAQDLKSFEQRITTNVELQGRCHELGIELKLPYSPVDDREVAREAKDFPGRSQPGGPSHGHGVIDAQEFEALQDGVRVGRLVVR